MPGDIVQAGVIISNSEVGLGSVNIQPLVYRLVCKNGMVVNDAATRRNHVGRINSADENFLLYSAETLAADDHAFMLKIQDTVRAAVDEANFSRVVGMMQEAAAVKMNTANVPEVVRLASRDFGITDEEHPGVLQHLIEGKDLTLYGLAQRRLPGTARMWRVMTGRPIWKASATISCRCPQKDGTVSTRWQRDCCK